MADGTSRVAQQQTQHLTVGQQTDTFTAGQQHALCAAYRTEALGTSRSMRCVEFDVAAERPGPHPPGRNPERVQHDGEMRTRLLAIDPPISLFHPIGIVRQIETDQIATALLPIEPFGQRECRSG
jgi:hypothetical protein